MPTKNRPRIGGTPARDLWLLPLISILTVLVMLAAAEVCARFWWPEQLDNSCRIPDSQVGFRYRPHCSAAMKSAEGPWYTNDYNGCGYRSAAPCGPLPDGTRRIAMVGSSVSEGYLVEYANTIGARLESEMSELCGAPVEVQNLAAYGYNGRRLVLRVEEALTLKPAAVLLVIMPFDVLDQDHEEPGASSREAAGAGPPSQSLVHRLFELASYSRSLTVARSLIFANDPTLYAQLYLHNGDKADFLRPPLTAAWEERLRRFEFWISQIADRTSSAGVPLTVVFVPNQAQVSLAASPSVLPSADPEVLQKAIETIAHRHGFRFIDELQALETVSRPGTLYYQVDGHPSGKGQRFVAHDVAEHYVDDERGPFTNCRSAFTR